MKKKKKKKIKLIIILRNIIIPYSKTKNNEKNLLENSVLNPETNSDSLSMKSNGIRLVSNKIKKNNRKQIKILKIFKLLMWLERFSKFKFKKIGKIKIKINIKPISYDNIWEIVRFDLITLYFLKEKNLAIKIKIEEILIKKINIIRLIIILLFSILIGKIFSINKNKIKIKRGGEKNFISLIFTRKFKFLENNLITSEKGWNLPRKPTFVGPTRKWKFPNNFRSITVKKATDIKIINKIII